MKRICIALLIGCFIILSGGCRKSTPQLDLDPELVSDLVYGYRHTINVYEPKSAGAEAYRLLADEVIDRIFE